MCPQAMPLLPQLVPHVGETKAAAMARYVKEHEARVRHRMDELPDDVVYQLVVNPKCDENEPGWASCQHMPVAAPHGFYAGVVMLRPLPSRVFRHKKGRWSGAEHWNVNLERGEVAVMEC